MSLEDFTTPLLLKIASEASTDSPLANIILLERHGASTLLSQILEYTDYLSYNDISPILWSVMHCFYPLTLLLLDTHSGININAQTSEGLTALHIAVLYGDAAIVELLLEQKGIDVNIMDLGGQMPLHYAAAAEEVSTTIVEMLVRGGADMRAAGYGGLKLANQARVNM